MIEELQKKTRPARCEQCPVMKGNAGPPKPVAGHRRDLAESGENFLWSGPVKKTKVARGYKSINHR